MRGRFICGLIFLCCLCGSVQASYVCPFRVFTNNGDYWGGSELNMYMTVSNGLEKVDFTFYNASSIESSLARIYFDDGSLLGIASVINGPGTDFSPVYPGPGNVPGAELLDPPFEADREFSIGAVAPPPENGVNPLLPVEWVTIKFDLISGGTLDDVIAELKSGELRVAIHIIDLPDGSSEAAINTPEPATITLLGLGALGMLKKRKI